MQIALVAPAKASASGGSACRRMALADRPRAGAVPKKGALMLISA